MEEKINVYLKSINGYKPLSREKEKELASIINSNGNKDLINDARNELVNHNLKFVVSVALSYYRKFNRHDDDLLMELITAGNDGLLEAAKRFDGDRGIKFISYAVWWIRQRIITYLDEGGESFKYSINMLRNHKKIESKISRLEQKLDRSPTLEELSSEVDMDEKYVEDLILAPIKNKVRRLDSYIGSEKKDNLYAVVSDEKAVMPDDDVVINEAVEHIDGLIERLEEREQYIIKNYYGLTGKETTLEGIANLLGITRERVRQLKDKALEKLIRYSIKKSCMNILTG